MKIHFSYKWPNPLFILWVIACLALAAFFYYCGVNLMAVAHQVLLGYEAWGIMVGFIMLLVLPFMLGLDVKMEGKPNPLVVEPEENVDAEPVGYSYFIPLVGWLVWQLPNLIKKREWVIILENSFLYFGVGLINGWYNYQFTWLYTVVMALAVVGEWFLYYKSWMPTLLKPKASGKNVALAYLFIQEHALSFLAVGWVTGLLLIGKI